MRHREWPLKLLLALSLATLISVLGYKIYLNFFEQDLIHAHDEQIAALQERLSGRDTYRFAVVGNIKNSVGLFERQIVPMLNEADVQLVVSAGNAVSGNSEDKYRALRESLARLEMPYLLTFGENESGPLGHFRFYEHFGPYFYAVEAADSLFLFLDTTGHSPLTWQLRWLERQLARTTAQHTFIFMGHPPLQPDDPPLLEDEDNYLNHPGFRNQLTELVQTHQVDAVFAANQPVYDRRELNGTAFVTTGGAGGLVSNTATHGYHYVSVAVSPAGVTIEPVSLDIGQHPILRTVEGLWLLFHSMVYVGYPNFFLLLGILGVVSISLYRAVFRERDYYPDFSLDPTPYRAKPLRVAMFTNNYLPFVGGVPISIDRLRRGLHRLGHQVRIVAPRYASSTDHEPQIIRAPSLMRFGQRGEFRIANIFSAGIRRGIREFAPEVVHVHHPFWLGYLGMLVALQLRVPVVYTYHTRLEHYAHYVPLPGPLFRNLISHALIRRFSNRCDAVIVPTQSVEDYLRMIGVHVPIFVQPTGIDYQSFHSGDSNNTDATAVEQLRRQLGLNQERVLISVSRLTREKNLDFLIDAIDYLRRLNPPSFHLLLVGDGAERERLQARIDGLGLSAQITLVGNVAPDLVRHYYALSDLFVFASKSETQGMVILEAMAAQLPVVAVRSSGIDDVINEGVDGYKTPERPDIWAARVRELLVDDTYRERMADAAEAHAQQYDLQPVAREIGEVYAYVLAAREAKRRSQLQGAQHS